MWYHDKTLSHCASRHSSHFCDNYNSISFQFSQLQVWKHLFHCLDCHRFWLICWKNTWSLVYHMTARGCIELMFLSIILPWLRIWIYFTVKPLGIKVIGLVLILWKLCNEFGHIVFILALDFHSIIIWRNFDCMVLRLWNTNTYNTHQIHCQVYKVW